MTRSLGFLAACAAGLGLALPSVAIAKTPGREYCFHGTCHTVKTIEETRRLVGITTKLKASFYDNSKADRYNPSNLTSSGEYFRADKPDNAASPVYPDGTKLLVWHAASGRALMVRVNNAGPYWGDRKLDLSRAAAEKFGITRMGVATVHVQVVEAPTRAEATYRRGRTYPPVQGYIGQFASLDAAAVGLPVAAPIRLAAEEAPRPKPVAEAAGTEPPRPMSAGPLTIAALPPKEPKSKPVRLTALDIKLAVEVEREARRFLTAQR